MSTTPKTVTSVLKAYRGAYRKRQAASNDGLVFPTAEGNALVGVLELDAALLTGSRALRASGWGRIEASLPPAGPEHDLPRDTVGYVVASAYGELPLQEPPLGELRAVLESGSQAGAVKGVFGVAWRAAFLDAALPLLNHEERTIARRELERRIGYLAEHLGSIGQDERLHEAGRLVHLIGRLRTGDASELNAQAGAVMERVASRQREDGGFPESGTTNGTAATAHLAQILLGARAAGLGDVAQRTGDYMLENRLDGRRRLLYSSALDDGRYELSPWVPRALLELSD